MSDIRFRQQRYEDAKERADLAVSILLDAERQVETNVPGFQRTKEIYQLQSDLVRIVGLNEPIADTRILPSRIKATQAFKIANQGNLRVAWDLSLEANAELEAIVPSELNELDRMQYFAGLRSVASAFAIISQSLPKLHSATESSVGNRPQNEILLVSAGEAEQQAIDVVRKLLVANPTMQETIHMDPDLGRLRGAVLPPPLDKLSKSK
jgi:hypothetical protein